MTTLAELKEQRNSALSDYESIIQQIEDAENQLLEFSVKTEALERKRLEVGVTYPLFVS